MIAVLGFASAGRAGLHCSLETTAELPSQWRGFLLDHRSLRTIGVPAGPKNDATPLREQYLREAKRLSEKPRRTADEAADLGAIWVRLGDVDRAVEHLRAAQRAHPSHFAVVANLGTAYQLQGNLAAAAQSLREAVRLAPGKGLGAEELHLKLVEARLRTRTPGGLDDLFGVRFGGPEGKYRPGEMDEAERKKLPARAVAHVQQLALWLPADGPLLWQLAELAGAHGDLRTATAMFEGCVVQFNLADPELRRRRRLHQEATEKLASATAPLGKAQHAEEHAGRLAFRSRKPLVSGLLDFPLPAIDPRGTNPVPWEVFTGTRFEGKFPPTFHRYAKELDGKTVSLAGFMQPLRETDDMTAFLLIEFPVGCWYCEMPELTGIVYVEMPAGETARYERGVRRVIGRLTLNADDPEEFFYAIRGARVAPAD